MNNVVVLLLPLLLFGGCSLFGLGDDSNDTCGTNKGLTLQTMKENYRVGEEVDLEVENCTRSTIYLAGGYCDGFTPPFYKLEKKTNDLWKRPTEEVLF